MANDSHESELERPDCMAVLGLSPPYSTEDVKQAFMAKATLAHPDHGGDAATFHRIQEAYELALAYVAIRKDRRSWIAGQMDRYLVQRTVEDHLRKLGAEFSVQHTEWLRKSLGDFAELTSAIETIALIDQPHGSELLALLVRHEVALQQLKKLVLVGCGLSSDQALEISRFRQLRSLDLRRNPLDRRIAELVPKLPGLTELLVDGSALGWWAGRQVQAQLRKRGRTIPPVA